MKSTASPSCCEGWRFTLSCLLEVEAHSLVSATEKAARRLITDPEGLDFVPRHWQCLHASSAA